jgi:hypothetical protein
MEISSAISYNEGNFLYNEIGAFPLEASEIAGVLQIITSFIKNNNLDLIVFYYRRDWEQGEIIWTPLADKIEAVQKKYLVHQKFILHWRIYNRILMVPWTYFQYISQKNYCCFFLSCKFMLFKASGLQSTFASL